MNLNLWLKRTFVNFNWLWQFFLTDSVANFSNLLRIFELYLLFWVCQTIQITDPIDHWSLFDNFNELYVPFTACRKWRLHFTVIKHSYFLNANPGRLINIKHRNLNPEQHVQAAGAAKAQPGFSHILSDSLGHRMRKHILVY